jgi:hypothetical protein
MACSKLVTAAQQPTSSRVLPSSTTLVLPAAGPLPTEQPLLFQTQNDEAQRGCCPRNIDALCVSPCGTDCVGCPLHTTYIQHACQAFLVGGWPKFITFLDQSMLTHDNVRHHEIIAGNTYVQDITKDTKIAIFLEAWGCKHGFQLAPSTITVVLTEFVSRYGRAPEPDQFRYNYPICLS